MQTFIFGLLLAGISGVTVLAFKQPYGFARLFPYLLGIATILFVGITIWHVAVQISWQGLSPYLVQESRSDAERTIARLTCLTLGLRLGIWAVLLSCSST